jgi:hypothetical protein
MGGNKNLHKPFPGNPPQEIMLEVHAGGSKFVTTIGLKEGVQFSSFILNLQELHTCTPCTMARITRN